MEIKLPHPSEKRTCPVNDPHPARWQHRSLWRSNALLALWLALAGNLPLWKTLVLQEELHASVVLFATFGLVNAAAVCDLLSASLLLMVAGLAGPPLW